MRLNFFDENCQEGPIAKIEFGLCDDRPGEPAYTEYDDSDSWNARVVNGNEEWVTFTAVDKCVIQDHQYPDRGRCDAMLTTSKCLYLVELKDQAPPWQSHALDQLVSTINFLKENHDISRFKIRKVFACNKKREHFIVFDNEEQQRFYQETSFRKDFQTDIIII